MLCNPRNAIFINPKNRSNSLDLNAGLARLKYKEIIESFLQIPQRFEDLVGFA